MRALRDNYYKCPKCDYHTAIGSEEYFELLFDDHQFVTLHDDLVSVDVLHFTDLKPYDKRLEESRKKTGLNELINACLTARAVWNTRVSTGKLNRWLEGIIAHHSPPLVRGRRLKIKYVTQVKTRPPTFHLFCNMADEFPESYLRYLTANLRESFNMTGTPIRLILKDSSNPFEKNKRRVNQKATHLRPKKKAE